MNTAFIPILHTVRTYTLKKFRWDLIAGITLAMFVLPESMAYAGIAGLPAQFGIYGCLAGGLFYALFTQTNQLAVGPTSAISLMIGSAVGVMAGNDYLKYLSIVSLTSFVVFCMFMLAYFIKLYSIVNFVSDSVLSGFKTGAALSIASTQIPLLFGLKSNGHHFFERLYHCFIDLPLLNLPVLIFSLISLAVLLVLQHYFPRKPNSLYLVLLSIVCVYLFPEAFSFLTPTEPIPKGLPQLQLPSTSFSDFEGIIGLAFGCFLMAFIETTSVARTLAENDGKEVSPEKETLALGVANMASSLTGSLPVSGGLSQSQVNAQAGAKTSIALVICSVFLCVFLIFATKPLQYLPQVILSVLILSAIGHLFNLSYLTSIRKYSRNEFNMALLAIAAVLIFGILKGVIFSSIISLIYLIANISKPRVSELGRIPNTTMFSDIAFHPDNQKISGVAIFRVESSILYFNQQHVFESLSQSIQNNAQLKLVVLDLSSSPMVDMAGGRMIQKLELQLRKQDVQLKIVEALLPVREMLRKFNLENHVGKISRKVSVFEVIHDFENSLKTDEAGIREYW